MWEALLVVVVILVVVGAGLRFAGWWIRRRGASRIPRGEVVREVRGVTMRVLVQGTRALAGMSTRNANRTRGDLVLGRDRFVLVTNRGVIADVGPEGRRPFTSVRCTGPGRLVIEGDVPQQSGRPGLFRVELPLPDAEEWAAALQPFAQREGRTPRFGRRPKPPAS